MTLDAQIDQWHRYVRAHRAIAEADVDELESHLRDRIDDLMSAGLAEDEAFLVAVKRLGNVDAISREFAREHSDRLWKQLVLTPAAADTAVPTRELPVVLALALGAGLTVRAALAVLGETRALLNAALLVAPFLAGYFVWKRKLGRRFALGLGTAGVAIAVAVNAYPMDSDDATFVLALIHTPVVLWFAVGIAYVGGRWESHRHRMDFIRFTGEWAVYYVLIALGGAALVGLTAATFNAVGIDAKPALARWIVPIGAAGAVLVAAWLVEAKQAVIENIAPVLTRVFTPLATLMLTAILVAFATDPNVIDVSRDLLILMAVILVLVVGLQLYAISARDPRTASGPFDRLQLALVVLAILIDAAVLFAMAARIAEFGASANKIAALGLNVVLLGNLVRAAWLALGFVRGRRPFADVERWQTAYLPVYALWATIVTVAFPPLFSFA
jgi:hypothetical protein